MFAMKLIAKLKVIAVAKWVCQKSVAVTEKFENSAVSGGALMAGQMRMSLNTVCVTDNPTIHSTI